MSLHDAYVSALSLLLVWDYRCLPPWLGYDMGPGDPTSDPHTHAVIIEPAVPVYMAMHWDIFPASIIVSNIMWQELSEMLPHKAPLPSAIEGRGPLFCLIPIVWRFHTGVRPLGKSSAQITLHHERPCHFCNFFWSLHPSDLDSFSKGQMAGVSWGGVLPATAWTQPWKHTQGELRRPLGS